MVATKGRTRMSSAAAGTAIARYKEKLDPTDLKRLNLNLSSSVYDELANLAKERRSSMTEIVRLALGLVKIILREAKSGNKFIIASSAGEPLKEVVIPD
jgi:hypothetical protein